MTVLIEGLLKGLDLKLFEEHSVLLECLFEVVMRGVASLLWICLRKGTIDGSKVRQIFVLIEMEFDFAIESVDLSI